MEIIPRMAETVIRVENLGKNYVIRHQLQDRYLTFRDIVAGKARFLGRLILRSHGIHREKASRETFWALKKVSFEVRSGDIIGIIGKNGAGKSTLLKILSRITEPSTGRIRITGRMASLLEVGTGFHPELSGRENIFLNGAILGMQKNEIKRKFDEIVAFAEVEKFLDTPVKRYSSGMYVRLAFAVAAHLDPEILLIDEVLAVGDIGFQNKCLGKMESAAKEGRTVLFVSHNMPAIGNLSSRVIVMEAGTIIFDGDTKDGIEKYSELMLLETRKPINERLDRTGNGAIKIVSFQILNQKGLPVQHLLTGEKYIFRFGYQSAIRQVNEIDFAFAVRDSMNRLLFRNRTTESGIRLPQEFPKHGYLDCVMSKFPLTKGRFGFGLRLLVNGEESDYIRGGYAGVFNVIEGDYFGTGKITSFAPVVVPHYWRIEGRRDE